METEKSVSVIFRAENCMPFCRANRPGKRSLGQVLRSAVVSALSARTPELPFELHSNVGARVEEGSATRQPATAVVGPGLANMVLVQHGGLTLGVPVH